MNVYIATSLSNANEARELSAALLRSGIETTYAWWTHGRVWAAKHEYHDCKKHGHIRPAGEHSQCVSCEGGLGGCVNCGQWEAALTETCPATATIEHAQWRCAHAAISERDGVRAADLVIVILTDSAQHGTHTEMGMAIALDKPVLLFASSAARFETAETCAFYFAPTIDRRVIIAAGEATRVEQMGAAIYEWYVKRSHHV